MKTAFYISLILTIIGGVNWGLVGLLGIDLVAALFGAGSVLALATYTLVGVAAIALGILSANVIVPESSAPVKRTSKRRAHA